MRHIILHIHLFKNAGTSVDHILRQNFSGRWVTREFSPPRKGHTPDIAGWITKNPQAVAFSSHTIQSPLPRIEGVRIIPLVLLRDPVDRIVSAYRFERVQDADTLGTRLARRNGFAGYVHARLETPGDRQCRNFQTSRLAALSPDAPGTELQRARATLAQIAGTGVLGLVSQFDTAMRRLQAVVKPFCPSFDGSPVMANASGDGVSRAISPDMREMLEETNRDDLALIRYAQGILSQASTGLPAVQRSGI